jgi:hypothetical protein
MRASSATRQSVKTLAEMPALRLSAQDWSHEIATAAQEARRFDQQAFAEARHGFERMAAEMAAHLRSTRSAERQRQWLIWTTAGSIVAGMLLLAIIVGPVVRAMPESWHWPERMAASILGMDEETAGVHLIKTAAPERWRDIVAGYQIISDNRAAIAQCERSEARTTPKIRCAIEIRSPNSM